MSQLDDVSPKVWRPQASFSLDVRSAAQLEQFNEEGGIAVNFRPQGRAITHVQLAGSQTKTLSVWKTRSQDGFITVPKIATDVLTIRLVTEGALVRRNQSTHYVGRPGRAMLVAYQEMSSEEASPGFEAISGTITRLALLAGHRALSGEDAGPLPVFAPLVEVDRLPMKAFMHSFAAVQRTLKAGVTEEDLSFPLLEELLVYQLLSSWPRMGAPDQPDGRRDASPSAASTARDYIDAHLARKLTVGEVAAAAGVSVRVLQLAFRRRFGCTPLRYILESRLDRAHVDLVLSGDQGLHVSTIAHRWGFNHMSEFSRLFRRRFGHSPTQAKTGDLNR